MRNRCKTLLRDHLVPEVTLKACPRHYSVSAVPETLTVRGPKRPPNIGTVHLIEGRTPSEEEAQEIIHELRVEQQEVDELKTGSKDDFITNNDQV